MRKRRPVRSLRTRQESRGTTTLRARSPGDLLGVVPYLLGFHPAESVVMVLLGERKVTMAARIDAVALEDPSSLAQYLDQLRRAQRAERLITITYSADPRRRELTEALAAELDPLVLVDAMVADGERWWSVICDGPCCPAEGTPYDAGSAPTSAAAVYAGLTALPDRTAVQALVAGPPVADEVRLEDLADLAAEELVGASVGTRQRLVRRLMETALKGDPLADADCLRLALLVSDLRVRDTAWVQLRRERAGEHVELWRQVVARTPSWLASAPLCLLGTAAWVSGNGALLNCCLERLEVIDPTYSMGSLLADISVGAVPPSCWDGLVADLRRHPDVSTG